MTLIELTYMLAGLAVALGALAFLGPLLDGLIALDRIFRARRQ